MKEFVIKYKNEYDVDNFDSCCSLGFIYSGGDAKGHVLLDMLSSTNKIINLLG